MKAEDIDWDNLTPEQQAKIDEFERKAKEDEERPLICELHILPDGTPLKVFRTI